MIAQIVAEQLAAQPSGTSQVIDVLKRYTPSCLAGLLTGLALLFPAIQGYISEHPGIAAILAGVGSILAHLAPSPLPGKGEP